MMLDMLAAGQAAALADARPGHNSNGSPDYFREIISTRMFDDRLGTFAEVCAGGIAVCFGGIVGIGESRADRVRFLHALATFPRHGEGGPINAVVSIDGRSANAPGQPARHPTYRCLSQL